MERQLGLIEHSFNARYSSWAKDALDELDDSFLITDPCISGNPIVFASNGFSKIFGYSKDEVIGKNGRVFQGPKTDRRAVIEIREAIRAEKDIDISLLNYRKDGKPLWMLFHMCPVYSKEDGKLIHFLGVQVPLLRRLRSSSHDEVVRDKTRRSHDTAFRCCRKEVSFDIVMGNGHGPTLDYFSNLDDRELDVDEPCEASEQEKQKASAAINNVLSILMRYSQLTGRLVCGKGCCLPGRSCRLPGLSLNFSLGRIKQSFVLMDPHFVDTPIVYVSDEFLRFSGYARHELLGHNFRYLSGQDTDPATEFLIKDRIRADQPCTVCILNYRKDKTSYWNFLHISPVRNATGKVTYFVGVHLNDYYQKGQEPCEVSPHRQHLSVVGAVKVAVRSLSMTASTS